MNLKRYFHDDSKRKEHISWHGSTGVAISAQFDFQTGLTTDDCPVPAAVLEKL